jgi:glycosyltransferase involved in cell wall biosynthesis
MQAGSALADLARRIGAEVVQVNAPALAAGGRFDQPVVAMAHSCVCTWSHAVRGRAPDPDLAWRAELTRAGLEAADQVVTPSAAFADALRHCYGLTDMPAVVLNGRRPTVVMETPRQDFAFTAGRLWDEAKNMIVLDRAAAALGVPFLAAGSTAAPHGAAIACHALQALGQINDDAVAAHLAARPVFVSSAVYEPFGLAVLEAAQAGCALVLSDIPTFRELWEGAATFVYPHDAEGFARAVSQIMEDPKRRTELGEAARQRSAAYTVTRTAERMRTIYDQLLADAPARRAAA